MRRITTTATALAASTLVLTFLAPVATAVDATDPVQVVRTVNSTWADSTPFELYNKTADSKDVGTGTYTTVAAPTSTAGTGVGNLSDGVLKLDVGTEPTTNIALQDSAYTTYANYTFDFTTNYFGGVSAIATPGAVRLEMDYLQPDASAKWGVDVFISPASGGAPVTYTYALPASAQWEHFNARTALFPGTVNGTAGNYTISQLQQTGDRLLGIRVGTEGAEPAAGTAMYVDNIYYGFKSEVDAAFTSVPPCCTFVRPTLYDFATSTAPTVTQAATTATITSGAATPLSATVRQGANPLAGAIVSLYAKRSGTTTFSKVGTATANSSGVATLPGYRPTSNATYYWKYEGVGTSREVTTTVVSGNRTVNVAPKLSVRANATSFAHTTPLMVYGVTVPAKPGSAVSLYWDLAADRLLATARVQSDGSLLLARALGKGSYTVFVSLPASSANAAGRSSAIRVTVS